MELIINAGKPNRGTVKHSLTKDCDNQHVWLFNSNCAKENVAAKWISFEQNCFYSAGGEKKKDLKIKKCQDHTEEKHRLCLRLIWTQSKRRRVAEGINTAL